MWKFLCVCSVAVMVFVFTWIGVVQAADPPKKTPPSASKSAPAKPAPPKPLMKPAVPHAVAPHETHHPSVAHPGPIPSHHAAGVSHPNFRGRDYHHFSDHERTIWHGGGWRHEHFGGRYGWWWVAGGIWYFYPEPIYPYPTVISEIIVEEPVAIQPVQSVVVQPAPASRMIPLPASQAMWYWCDNPKGYSPYVASCPGGWKRVPVGSPPAP